LPELQRACRTNLKISSDFSQQAPDGSAGHNCLRALMPANVVDA
jgi:hypothetical protein